MVSVEFTRMISKKFTISDLDLTYSVGISQIHFNCEDFQEKGPLENTEEVLHELLKIIGEIQEKYSGSVINLLNDEFILNEQHIFKAAYFTLKAFSEEINISNQINIELFLYLAADRQIKNAIHAFGLSEEILDKG
ncbi:MAG: hypothetical protein EU548_08435, partial [Promethearchaeota archaeon]